jgi:hypothetical protein
MFFARNLYLSSVAIYPTSDLVTTWMGLIVYLLPTSWDEDFSYGFVFDDLVVESSSTLSAPNVVFLG